MQLPVELLELIVMKAAFKLWRDLWTTDVQPNSRVLGTLATVCYDWTVLLIERKWVRRHLRRHLKGALLTDLFAKRLVLNTILTPTGRIEIAVKV